MNGAGQGVPATPSCTQVIHDLSSTDYRWGCWPHCWEWARACEEWVRILLWFAKWLAVCKMPVCKRIDCRRPG